ncbi:MAG TPA: DUF393 domain-containing protein [Candidatus Limnocylindrales bacterium]|nr:DUF393 domain-containing protein [Candidatus Limnocylindrales bacterium]
MSSTLTRIANGSDAARQARVRVFFDADCGFCTRSAEVLRRLDWRRNLDLVPLQAAARTTGDAPRVDVLLGAMHVRDQAGRWSAGGAACLRIAEEVPILRPFAVIGRLPLIRRLVEPAYALVSAHRHQLGRVLGEDACSTERRAP